MNKIRRAKQLLDGSLNDYGVSRAGGGEEEGSGIGTGCVPMNRGEIFFLWQAQRVTDCVQVSCRGCGGFSDTSAGRSGHAVGLARSATNWLRRCNKLLFVNVPQQQS